MNAECDVRIFNALFLERTNKKVAAHTAIHFVADNIVNVLDKVVDLFEEMTGEHCAACLQLADLSPDSADRRTVRTVRRDWKSHNRINYPPQPLDGNDFFEQIFMSGVDYLEPNFRSKVRRGDIKTTIEEKYIAFESLYMFTIPDVRAESKKEPSFAALSIDSQRPLRQDRIEVCVHFAKELTWRLGTMYYRLDRLAHHIEELDKSEGRKNGKKQLRKSSRRYRRGKISL